MKRNSFGKPLWLFFFLISVFCSFALRAQAQAVVSVDPRHGEIRLMGTVMEVRQEQSQFVLLAQRVLVPDGTELALTQPKTRMISVGQTTTFAVFTGNDTVPFTDADLSKLAVGTLVLIVGRDSTSVKGQTVKFASRLVCLLLPPTPQKPEIPRPPSEPPGKNLLLPTDKPENWGLTSIDPAQATVEADEGAVKVIVAKPGKEDWRVQLSQTGALPETGVSYTLTFRARAEPARRVRVSAQVLGSDFHDIGINRVAVVGSEWAQYQYTFVAQDLGAKGHLVPVFFFGTKKGTTWIADATLAVSYPQERGNLLESARNPAAWQLVSLTKEGRASLRISGEALEVSTNAVSKQAQEVAYHLLPSSPAMLIPGRNYVLTFLARSGAERTLRIRGVRESIKLSSEEKTYELHFRVNRPTDFGICPTFILAEQLGTFTLRDLVLHEEPGAKM